MEQRPDELLSSVERCVEAVTEKLRGQGVSLERLAGVGITNQRETTILWHRGTGRPLYNAVVWCDARCSMENVSIPLNISSSGTVWMSTS